MTERGLRGESITREEALEILRSSDDELMSIIAAAGKVRRHFFFDNRVRLNYLVNLKSGLCPEDCSYCSQRLGSRAEIMKYSWADPQKVHDAVEAGIAGGARRVCMVASGHGPSRETSSASMAWYVPSKPTTPTLRFVSVWGLSTTRRPLPSRRRAPTLQPQCQYRSLSLRQDLQYPLLRGQDGYRRSPQAQWSVALLRSYCRHGRDRRGIRRCYLRPAQAWGRFGAGEFLAPLRGTPLAGGAQHITPQWCLKRLAMVRFAHPDSEVRAAAGREQHIRTMQPLALEVVNSIFLGDYLTSEGAAGAADLQMIEDGGFIPEGADGQPMVHTDVNSHHSANLPVNAVPIRHRGIGTEVPANA
ncbi:biotin synthase [Cutibacterium acnes JCM 18918]|nr:biotin synthase [Cutibacterium acnes JCM 18918]